MSIANKGAVGLGVVGVLATGSYLALKASKNMPTYTTVADATATPDGYSGKIGADYKHLLVDTGANEDWWKWSYNRWLAESKKESHQLSDEFKNSEKVASAFSSETNNTTALNKVCDTVYKKEESNNVSFDQGSENKHKLGTDLLRFCSPIGQKPASIQNNEGYETSNIGGGSDKTNLASTKAQENVHFWSAMHKYLSKEGSKPTDAFFNRISGEKTIQTLCEEAYKTTSSTSASSTNPNTTEVKKYCAFAKLTTAPAA